MLSKEPRRAQSTFSSETEPTLWKAIPILECIRASWNIFAKADKFKALHSAILKGLEKLEKWYSDVKHSDAYLTSLSKFFHILNLSAMLLIFG